MTPSTRNRLLLALGLVLLLFAGWRFYQNARRPGPRSGPPPGYLHVFRCGACGNQQELEPSEIARQYREDLVRADAGGGHFFQCPKCQEIRMTMITLTPDGEQDRVAQDEP